VRDGKVDAAMERRATRMRRQPPFFVMRLRAVRCGSRRRPGSFARLVALASAMFRCALPPVPQRCSAANVAPDRERQLLPTVDVTAARYRRRQRRRCSVQAVPRRGR
jgi:hypothetical protein